MSLDSHLASLPAWHGGEAAFRVQIYGPRDWQASPSRMADMVNIAINTSVGEGNFKKMHSRAVLTSGDKLAHGGLTLGVYGGEQKIQFLSPCCLSPLAFRPVSRQHVQYEACRACSNPLVPAPSPLTGGGRRRSARNLSRHAGMAEALDRWTDALADPLLASLAVADLVPYVESVFLWAAGSIEAEERRLKAERVRASQEAKRMKTRRANESFLAALLEELEPSLDQASLARVAQAGQAKLDS